jgi:hypothetical protein
MAEREEHIVNEGIESNIYDKCLKGKDETVGYHLPQFWYPESIPK